MNIPKGMNKDYGICKKCWTNLHISKSTEILNDCFRLFDPYQICYEKGEIIIGEYIPEIWKKYSSENPSFQENYNHEIDACAQKIDDIDEMIKGYEKEKNSYEKKKAFNRGWSLVDRPSSLITGTLTGNAYDQNTNALKIEIKKLESQKKQLIEILRNLPWQVAPVSNNTNSMNTQIPEIGELSKMEKSGPLDILKIRLAKGEITLDEFNKIKENLE